LSGCRAVALQASLPSSSGWQREILGADRKHHFALLGFVGALSLLPPPEASQLLAQVGTELVPPKNDDHSSISLPPSS
jgi:hypothetical protein